MSLTSLAITLELPESVKLGKNEARDLLTLRLLDEGRLSQSQAAKALGITRRELLELMARHQVPVVRPTVQVDHPAGGEPVEVRCCGERVAVATKMRAVVFAGDPEDIRARLVGSH